ncbi:MAG: hypothetical protein ABIO94_05615 [Opitutaceae bacterium]
MRVPQLETAEPALLREIAITGDGRVRRKFEINPGVELTGGIFDRIVAVRLEDVEAGRALVRE